MLPLSGPGRPLQMTRTLEMELPLLPMHGKPWPSEVINSLRLRHLATCLSRQPKAALSSVPQLWGAQQSRGGRFHPLWLTGLWDSHILHLFGRASSIFLDMAGDKIEFLTNTGATIPPYEILRRQLSVLHSSHWDSQAPKGVLFHFPFNLIFG